MGDGSPAIPSRVTEVTGKGYSGRCSARRLASIQGWLARCQYTARRGGGGGSRLDHFFFYYLILFYFILLYAHVCRTHHE